jgi:hypothetical protein
MAPRNALRSPIDEREFTLRLSVRFESGDREPASGNVPEELEVQIGQRLAFFTRGSARMMTRHPRITMRDVRACRGIDCDEEIFPTKLPSRTDELGGDAARMKIPRDESAPLSDGLLSHRRQFNLRNGCIGFIQIAKD